MFRFSGSAPYAVTLRDYGDDLHHPWLLDESGSTISALPGEYQVGFNQPLSHNVREYLTRFP
jgi:hypothetical protein